MRRALLLAAAAAACGVPSEQAGPPRERRVTAGRPFDVLLITIDTLRADHLGVYGYPGDTSPNIDALAGSATVFERAYTYWPKTRASFVMMMTGLTPPHNGFSKTHPQLLGFNQTLAELLRDAGYETAAAVDNPNVAAELGYAEGFDEYLETWEDPELVTEMDRTRAITAFARERLTRPRERPLFLWLHYVNPHTPYLPPAPFDTAFLPPEPDRGPELGLVQGLHGGIPERWAVPGERRLGYYVAQYDGEVAAVDREVGEVLGALEAGRGLEGTVVVLTSDHGESLGEHDYYFDHGADLFEPSMAVPLIVALPRTGGGRRSSVLASTLDVVPTVLDAVKVSFPPGLEGESLLAAALGREAPDRRRLFGQNDHSFRGTWDDRYKLVVEPVGGERERHSLYDLEADPGERRDVRRERPEAYLEQREALERYFAEAEERWVAMRRRLAEGEAESGEPRLSKEACRRLAALGYITAGCD